MAIPEFNHIIIRNKQYSFKLAITTDGAPTDLTGGTIKLAAKYSYTDSDDNAAFVKTAANGVVVTDAINGQVTITIFNTDTTLMAEHRTDLVNDVQFTDSTGVPWAVVRGKITVLPDVTTVTP